MGKHPVRVIRIEFPGMTVKATNSIPTDLDADQRRQIEEALERMKDEKQVYVYIVDTHIPHFAPIIIMDNERIETDDVVARALEGALEALMLDLEVNVLLSELRMGKCKSCRSLTCPLSRHFIFWLA